MADLGSKIDTNLGKVNYDESIINGIVAVAVSNVEGVVFKSDKKGNKSLKDSIKIVSDKTGVHVTVKVSVLYGYSIPDIAFNIQHTIKQSVEAMSRYHITDVDVFVNDVLFRDKAV